MPKKNLLNLPPMLRADRQRCVGATIRACYSSLYQALKTKAVKTISGMIDRPSKTAVDAISHLIQTLVKAIGSSLIYI